MKWKKKREKNTSKHKTLWKEETANGKYWINLWMWHLACVCMREGALNGLGLIIVKNENYLMVLCENGVSILHFISSFSGFVCETNARARSNRTFTCSIRLQKTWNHMMFDWRMQTDRNAGTKRIMCSINAQIQHNENSLCIRKKTHLSEYWMESGFKNCKSFRIQTDWIFDLYVIASYAFQLDVTHFWRSKKKFIIFCVHIFGPKNGKIHVAYIASGVHSFYVVIKYIHWRVLFSLHFECETSTLASTNAFQNGFALIHKVNNVHTFFFILE